LRLYVKLQAIRLTPLLLSLGSLSKRLLIFYQAIHSQIAVAVIHDVRR